VHVAYLHQPQSSSVTNVSPGTKITPITVLSHGISRAKKEIEIALTPKCRFSAKTRVSVAGIHDKSPVKEHKKKYQDAKSPASHFLLEKKRLTAFRGLTTGNTT